MKKGLIIIILFCAFISCKRENDPNKFGPETIISPADFTVSGFTVNPSGSIDLADEDAYFSCTMPQRAEFKIIITGLLSGAEKEISGVGEFIDLSNSNWTGDSDNLNIFRAGEECAIELSFRGAIKKYYDTITVSGANVYPNTLLINDFEGFFLDKTTGNAVAYGNYIDSTDLDFTDIRTDNTVKPCQGTQSILYDGRDIDNDTYVGGMYFFPVATPYDFGPDQPVFDSLYLNAYVYGYGDNLTTFVFAFTEDENNDNVGNSLTEDTWVKEVTVEGTGWTLVKLRLRDFTDEKPTVGNGTRNFDRIAGFNVNVKSKKPGGRVKANLDYITITYGRPFQP